jgi:hypothetical protein
MLLTYQNTNTINLRFMKCKLKPLSEWRRLESLWDFLSVRFSFLSLFLLFLSPSSSVLSLLLFPSSVVPQAIKVITTKSQKKKKKTHGWLVRKCRKKIKIKTTQNNRKHENKKLKLKKKKKKRLPQRLERYLLSQKNMNFSSCSFSPPTFYRFPFCTF